MRMSKSSTPRNCITVGGICFEKTRRFEFSRWSRRSTRRRKVIDRDGLRFFLVQNKPARPLSVVDDRITSQTRHLARAFVA